jgi:hypothetical protein
LISLLNALGVCFRTRPFSTFTFHNTTDSFLVAFFIELPFFSLGTSIPKKITLLILNMGYTLYSEYGLTINDSCK